MKLFAFFLQIRELLKGEFNWQGLLLLILFVLMGIIPIGFAIFAGYRAFQPKKRDDV